ncbi:MAG: ATP synthase subunit I [Rhodoferax sp.]|uniref:ATP synthase subunit I n=1 Tax=Rhodoferax sp. TaxID=50421 RepID=UPI00260D6F93|nr:ATP synthase subunit I [Rhodoferax sp.]MDD2882776.1 ATP synthase subunit I [Rhodoferax sp.]
MVTIPPSEAQDSGFESDPPDFVPLTRLQAQALAKANPSVSPWWVVLGQVLVGVLASLIAWVIFGEAIARSVACGAVAVVIPAALFARGLTSQFAAANPGMAVVSFFVWELVKIVVTVGVLFAAHRLVKDLSWPAMLVGLILTLKVYWLALAFKRKTNPVQ